MHLSRLRKAVALIVSATMALSLCPAAAFAAGGKLAAGAVQTQLDPSTEVGKLPFYIEETSDGVVDADVAAQKLTLLGSNAQVVGYDVSQGSGYLLIKENNRRDGYYHLYLVGKKGVAHEFQNTDEGVIDGITIEKCWTGGDHTDGSYGSSNRYYGLATVNHMDAYQSLYAVKAPSGAYDVYNADTGEYFTHQLDSQPSLPMSYFSIWLGSGVSCVKKDGLEGFLKADGSYLYAPKFADSTLDKTSGIGEMPDGTKAVITPRGCGVSADGTKIESWDSVHRSDGLYAEVSNEEDSQNTLIRLSTGTTRLEPEHASLVYVDDSSAISYGSDEYFDFDQGKFVYSYTAIVYNEAYPEGFDVAAAYSNSEMGYFKIRKGKPEGYVVTWSDYTETFEYQGDSKYVYHTILLDEKMNVVDEVSGGFYEDDSYGNPDYYVPIGCYGELVFYQNPASETIKCTGPKGAYTGIRELRQIGGKVVVIDGNRVWSAIDPETGARKFSFYSRSFDDFDGMCLKYWRNEDFDPEQDEFGLINPMTYVNSGVKYRDVAEEAFYDEDTGFYMGYVGELSGGSAASGEDDYDGDDLRWYWVDGNFNEIAALDGAHPSEFPVNTNMLVDPATKTILVIRDGQGDGSKDFELLSYASGSVQKVTSFDVYRLRSKLDRWGASMRSDYALAISEDISDDECLYGLISRDGNMLVDPSYDYYEAQGRNLFAFSNEVFITGNPYYGEPDNLNMHFYDHTGTLLARFAAPYVRGLDKTSGDYYVRATATQSECPFGGDLTAIYRSAEDANTYYIYDFGEVNNAAATGHVRVTEEMLYTADEYSELLENSDYNKRSQRVRGKLMDQITASNTDANYALSYAKAMMKGWTKSLETAWKDRLLQPGNFNGTERELYEELAQELVEGIMKGSGDSVFEGGGLVFDTVKEAIESFDESFKSYKRYKKIFKYADTDTETIRQYSKFLEKIMTPSWEKPGSDRRYAMFQSLQEKDFYDKLDDVETFVERGIDILDAVTTYACICRLNAEIVHSIALYAPEDSGLRYGLTSLEKKISNPTANMVIDFIENQLDDALVDIVKEYGVEEAMKSMLGLSSSALSGYIAIGALFYYVISENIQTATLSDRLKAEFALHNANAMDTAMRSYREHIIAQNDEGKNVNFEEARKRYMLLFSAYNESLSQVVEALDAVVEADGGNPSNLAYRGAYDASKDALTYEAYIRSCRGCAEAVWEGQVADGKLTVTKYVPGRSARSFGGSYAIDVPEEVVIDGVACQVAGIASGAFDGVAVEGIYVPSTVSTIGSGAFAGASGLTTVYVPSTIEEIAADAFGDDASGVTLVGEPSDALAGFVDANTGAVVEEAEKAVADGGVTLAGGQSVVVSFDEATGALSVEGLELRVTYGDGTVETVTEGYTIEPKNASTVIVSYGGVSIEVAVNGGSVGRPVTVRYVDADGMELVPADVFYVAYGAKRFDLPYLPKIDGYRPTSDSTSIATEGDADEYFVEYARVILGDNDLVCPDSMELEEGATSVEPEVVVTLGGKTLVRDVDYTVEYRDNVADEDGEIGAYDKATNAYYAHVVVTGIGEYMGTAVASVKVGEGEPPYDWRSDLSLAEVTFPAKYLAVGGYLFTTGQSAAPTVSLGGGALPAGAYAVQYLRAQNGDYSAGVGSAFPKLPGDYRCLVKGVAPYFGESYADFKVLKANNTLSAKAKSKQLTVKHKKLKKKAQTIKPSKAFVVAGAKGAVTFVKLSGHKKISVSRAGKITIKKKALKKGKTYKLKVKVTAAGNAYYKPAAKTVTLKIKAK